MERKAFWKNQSLSRVFRDVVRQTRQKKGYPGNGGVNPNKEARNSFIGSETAQVRKKAGESLSKHRDRLPGEDTAAVPEGHFADYTNPTSKVSLRGEDRTFPEPQSPAETEAGCGKAGPLLHFFSSLSSRPRANGSCAPCFSLSLSQKKSFFCRWLSRGLIGFSIDWGA